MLINRRNALMTDKRLPYDAEVEFLQSTGTQWIDTGVLPDFDMIARITLSYQQDSCYPVWGTRGTSYNNRAYTSAYNTNAISTSTFYGGQFDNVISNNITNIKPAVGQIFDFKLSKDGGWLDGVKVNGWNGTPQPFTPYGTIYLFGRNDPANTKSVCRIYHFSLELNGNLVRDFIPVRKGAVGAIYDRRGVGGMNPDGSPRNDGMYFNRGTGDFVLGPDVVPVEYIESHGTEWIDTGVPAQNITSNISVFFNKSTTMTSSGVLGCRSASDQRYQIVDSVGIGNGYYSGTLWPRVYTWVNFETNTSGSAKIDGTPITATSGTFTSVNSANTVYLFAINRAGYNTDILGSNVRISDCKIFQNSALVRSFRPVRVGTDATSWDGAMMDVLTRRIYRNAGSGAFSYGNDLKYPIPAE